jgi:RimJ/RimL family protein N-acetyltransferase
LPVTADFLIHGDGSPPELIYAFGRDWWGRGLATEAAGAALRHGLGTVGFGQVVADVVPENTASARVLHKLGFEMVGTRSEAGIELDRYVLRAGERSARPGARQAQP